MWTTNSDGSATTTQPVTLNQAYHAPQNDKVTITFTKLPENPGSLTIKQVIVSTLTTQGLNPVIDTAYDITSTMADGTFEYTLTLPTPTTENVEVKASEDGQTFVTLGGVSLGDGVLTVTGLNHFTVFVVVGTISGTPVTATPFDESQANVVINEFVFNPSLGSSEWVEVFNKSNVSVNLTGWKLEDGNSLTTDDINLSGTIPAQGYAVFENNAWLNNTGIEEIRLKNGSSLVDQVSYKDGTVVGAQDIGTVAVGQSVARTTDGGTSWMKDTSPSKGWSNQLTTPTTVYVDINYSGLIKTGTQNQPFTTIQNGINAVAASGTVNVAAGEYDESDIQVTTEGVSIIGPGTASGVNRAFISTGGCAGSPSSIFHLHADGIRLTGLDIDGSGSCEHAVHVGGVTEIQVADVLLSGNIIHGADYGVTISWGSSNNTQLPNVISNNQIYGNNLAGVLLNSASNNSILQNHIHDNLGPGIELIDCLETGQGGCGSPAPSNNTITGNVIENNSSAFTGIHVINGGENNTANSNIISGNGVGVQNDDPNNFFDATHNFWGAASGPTHLTNSGGTGDSISDNVKYRPFYTNSARTTLSSTTIGAGDFSPASLFTSGIFSLPLGTTNQASTPSITINQETSFTAPAGAGISSVKLPFGVVIQRVGGGTIDASLLSVANASPATLSGFASGTAIDGALQWGIPNLGLEFTQAITLQIFVGTSLNGQTLTVTRSTTGTGGWTSEGIVSPGTCVVASGVCTFEATKASFYATTRTVSTSSTSTTSSSSGGGGGGGSASAPVCGDIKPGSAPTLLSATPGSNNVNLAWSKAKEPLTYYLLTYGLASGLAQYGNPNVGGKDTTSYTVQSLSGGTTYYFKVRAGNGCMPGDFSNELSAAPTGGTVSEPAAGFAPGVLRAETTQETVEQPSGGEVKSKSATQGVTVDQTQVTPSSVNLLPNIVNFFKSALNFFINLFK